MKITAGLGALEDYERLSAAGANELFAGFVPLDWLERYANFTPLNRREVLLQGIQLSTMDEMRLLTRRIADTGVPVALTFNSTCYLPEQYPRIAEMLEALGELGFQDWILADPALLYHLHTRGIPGRVHLSGEAGCFSPDALRFFARMGVSRCIFPRKITPEEMAAFPRALPELEYEAFALNELCHYSGAFCASLHCDELEHLCCVPYRPSGPAFSGGAPAQRRWSEAGPQATPSGPDCPSGHALQSPDAGPEAGALQRQCAESIPEEESFSPFGESGCALCALPALRRAGVTHLKIVGRGAHPESIARDIRLLRRALALGDASPEALRTLLPGRRCAGRCYYPNALL